MRDLLGRLITLGTETYPPETRRRLKILNVIAYLIAIVTTLFAVHQAATDLTTNLPAILINVLLIVTMPLVPLAHRVNDVLGGLLIVGSEFIALFGLTAFFGREGGAHLHYFIAAAAPFVVFGLGRLRLVFSVIAAGLLLHVAAWFLFVPEHALVKPGPGVVDPIYAQAAATTFALIAASVYYAFSLAEKAKAETDTLLRNILPESIVERLTERPKDNIADNFDEASILFADISGFVPLSRSLGAARTVELLNRLVSDFDGLAKRHGVEKIKTMGDAYMAASGLPEPAADHLERLARMSLDMLASVRQLSADTGLALDIRVGIATGPVTAGVIGSHKFSYDVWGDAVNLAARLEGASAPGRVLVCPDCFARLSETFAFESRGLVEIKGLGPRETWYLVGLASDRSTDGAPDRDVIRGCISAAS